MFNDSVSSWEGTADDETRMQIQGVRDQLKMIELELNGLAENGTATAEDINTLKGQITTEIEIVRQLWMRCSIRLSIP